MEINSLFKNSFKGKKVFITGHTGFKGAWLSVWLQSYGAQLKGYSLPPAKQSLFEGLQKDINIKSVYADIRDYKNVEKEILSFQPDFIFHLAAQPLVRYSYKKPLETFEVNAGGTANLLNAVTRLKKKCSVVVITTDKVYENKEQEYAYAETDKLGGHDPYSASKACAELIVQSYRLSFFNPKDIRKHKKSIATVRSGNVIGGGDYSADRIIPDIIRAHQKNMPIRIRNPRSVRPWQHVLDPLAGYLLLAVKMHSSPVRYSAAYNFGPAPKDVVTVEELVKVSLRFFGKGKYVVETPRKHYHEAGLLMLDNAKAQLELKWKPVYTSIAAIEHTLNWYKKSMSRTVSKFQLCLEDIERYITSV